MPCGQYLASGFLYINLGCHMMFVLKNRLKAQGIPMDKNVKIISDLADSIFKLNFITVVMTPQQPMSINNLKEAFRRHAHSSIMKLDNSSMEKLIYLIIMTIKKQFFLMSSPLQMYSVTLGNLQILQQYISETSKQSKFSAIIDHFVKVASNYRFIEYHQLRQYILSTLEPYQTKVVNFYELGQQTDKGKLVLHKRNIHNKILYEKNLKSSKQNEEIEYLQLSNWKNWKTSLVKDHASEYEKQTQKRNAIIRSKVTAKQKSINDLFNLGNENLNDFQVHFELFGQVDKRQSSKTSTKSKIPSKQQPKQIQKIQNKQSQYLRSKIEKQMQTAEKPSEQQLDLLDMMDN